MSSLWSFKNNEAFLDTCLVNLYMVITYCTVHVILKYYLDSLARRSRLLQKFTVQYVCIKILNFAVTTAENSRLSLSREILCSQRIVKESELEHY